MSTPDWTAIDEYITQLFVPPDPALDAALADSAAAGLPPINVAPNQGKLLHLLVRVCGARRVLEVGTLGGYSTIWLARAVPPGGRVVTLELQHRHAEVARANLERAGVGAVVDIKVGPASDSLATLVREGTDPFDFVFIDADKPGTADYFLAALELSRPGTVIVVDNVVRQGKVAAPGLVDADAEGIRRFNQVAAATDRVSTTEIQTVGVKGHDGFAFSVVES